MVVQMVRSTYRKVIELILGMFKLPVVYKILDPKS